MRDHKFLILRRRDDIFAQFFRAQGAVAQRHRHGLSFGLAEHQPIAARELRRRLGRPLELIDHLAFGDLHATDRHSEAEFGHEHLDIHFTDANFASERMRARVTTLRGVAERKKETFVAARQSLQTH